MIKLNFPALLLACVALAGCTETSKPTLTQSDVESALRHSENRLENTLRTYCDGISREQARQQATLSQLQANQRAASQQLNVVSEKLDRSPEPIVVVQTEKEPAECPVVAPPDVDGKMILGRTEWIWLEAINRTFRARVDSGAATSSLSAQEIVEFERDGKPWVRFNIMPDDDVDDVFEVEAPLVRIAKIRQASAEEPDRRVVVEMTVKIGEFVDTAEFTLTDRSAMTYPILLGREFLRDIALIDVAKSYYQPKPEPLPEHEAAETPEAEPADNNNDNED